MVATAEPEKKEKRSRKKILSSVPWSSQQQNIFSAVQDTTLKHLLVDAKAGVGKTVSICGAIASLPASLKILVIAFNRHIAEEIEKKLPTTVEVSTAHSMGLSMVRRFLGGKITPVVDDRKYIKIARDLIIDNRLASDKAKVRSLAVKLATFCKYCQLTLTDYNDESKIRELIDYYCLADDEDLTPEEVNRLVGLIPLTLENGIQQALESFTVSFDDQIWLPEVLDIQWSKKDFLFVDESQDSSSAMIALCKRLTGDTGRIVFVGDAFQSIQGFAGANPLAWENLRNTFKPKQLPLTICRRSPKSHIALAQKIVPTIEPADYAPDGEIVVLDPVKLFQELKPGTLVICRLTAPLVKLCLKAIATNIKARVRGREIGKQLGYLAKRVMEDQQGSFPDDFLTNLRAYCEPRIANFKTDDNEAESQHLEDSQQALEACFNEFGFNQYYLEGFCEKIDEIFCGDEDNPPVTFSTIHRAKGDEAPRVIILGSNWLPWLGRAKRQWQEQQEYNLQYVAITRCKFIKDDPDSGKLFLVPLPKKSGESLPSWILNDPYGGMGFPVAPFSDVDVPEDEEITESPVIPKSLPQLEPLPEVEFTGDPLPSIAELLDLPELKTVVVTCKPQPIPDEYQELYQWILNLSQADISKLPKPLNLTRWLSIPEPKSYIASLQRDTRTTLDYYNGKRPNPHPRSRFGALESDIKALKDFAVSAV